MPTYSYIAKNLKGQTKKGTIQGKSKLEIGRQLRSQGFVPIEIKQRSVSGKISKGEGVGSGTIKGLVKKILSFDVGSISGVSLSDKMMFSRHLAVMISSGVPITRALEVLGKQTKNIRFQNAISKIADDIRGGKRISDALSKHPDIFDNLYVSMVRSGDSAGNITEALELLAEQLKKEHELKSRVKGALMYPAVIVTAMIGIGILMMIMVVPKISQIFEEVNVSLPLTTRIVIGLSNFISTYWFIVLGAFPILVYIVKKLASTNRGRIFLSWFFLKMPILSGLTRKVNSARFSRTLSSLIEGGGKIFKFAFFFIKSIVCKSSGSSIATSSRFSSLRNAIILCLRAIGSGIIFKIAGSITSSSRLT